ncbi:transient receptor potential cation channel subfamily A member 1 [Microdochium nivale]|nr:transient receptor potential cation channel subfamily A member 1 [Microdochium nivale]
MSLHDAVSRDSDIAILEFLLQTGADVWACDESQSAALHAAAYVDNSLAIKLLLAHTSAKRKTRASTLIHPADMACLESSEPPHQGQLTTETALVNAKNEDARTALHCAAGNLWTQAVQELLYDKDIQMQLVDEDGRTALHLALQYSSELRTTQLTPTVDLLSSAGCPLDVADIDGMTAMDYALGRGFSLEAARVLLAAGAAIDAKSEGAEKLLAHAAEHGWDDTFLFLAGRGTPVLEPSHTLQLAAMGNSTIIASWIFDNANRRKLPPKRALALGRVQFDFDVPKAAERLRGGFNIGRCCNAQHDIWSASALPPNTVQERIVGHCCRAVQYATKPGNVAMVALLLRNAADFRSCCCVLHVAVSVGDITAVTALVAQGAPLGGCRLALSIAAKSRDARMVSLLQSSGADRASFGPALRVAVESESVQVVSLLVRDDPGLVASSGALQTAARLGKYTMTTFPLRQERSPSNVYSALLGAFRSGGVKMATSLVGSLKDTPGADGATLSEAAVEQGKLAVAAQLVEKGITLSSRVAEFATWRPEDSQYIPHLLKANAEAAVSANLGKAVQESQT